MMYINVMVYLYQQGLMKLKIQIYDDKFSSPYRAKQPVRHQGCY